ncbi:lipoprotein [Streptomyces sp. NL15-2K]|nr:CapA family protein [Kutzneria buriramensis]WKX06952.1 CapA family protein [Kutzneria buriramensis]GCB42943.1 lipoprotein [Streptomyces sp. NL15-2K]
MAQQGTDSGQGGSTALRRTVDRVDERFDERSIPRRSGAPDGLTPVASGDVLAHTSVIDRARFDAGGTGYDFRPMCAGVAPVVSRADLALCHMETVYGENGRTLDALDRAGVRHSGTARTEEESRVPTILRAGEANVAHLAYT